MYLEANEFKSIVSNTPLISIDLIITNESDRFLLGERTNRPARGFWFVPGGRVLKDEALDEAFRRLTMMEIGVEYSRADAQFLGVYEHFYDDNFSGTDFSTHYVVLGYKIFVETNDITYQKDQHSSYSWMSQSEILDNNKVHPNTKAYFNN